MYVAQVRINLLNDLAVEQSLQSQHSVSGGMLRTNVYHKVVVGEQRVVLFHQTALLVKAVLAAVAWLVVVVEGVAFNRLIVFAKRIAAEVAAQIESAHIGMA